MSKMELEMLIQWIILVVGILTLVVYYRQLRVMSAQLRSMQDASLAQSTLSLIGFLQQEDVRKARACVREVLAEKPLRDWTKEERNDASKVAANYDVAAAMVKNGLANERLICSNWGPSILHCYEVLEPYIAEMRSRPGADPRYWENFQWFSDRALCARRESVNSRESDGLERFVDAQAPDYSAVLEELKAGRKRSHWMWYVFPQMRGLGTSANAQTFGIGSLDEARAYLSHPVLGKRLDECIQLVMDIGRPVGEIFGSLDELKLKSCLTLFEAASGVEDSTYARALDALYAGDRDARTLELLGAAAQRA